MKKITVILALLMASMAFGQLSPLAQAYKNQQPERYECFKKFAEKDWSGDHVMIVYVINNQVEAYNEFLTYRDELPDTQKYMNILTHALKDWSENAELCTTNWEMVVYQVKNQLEALESY